MSEESPSTVDVSISEPMLQLGQIKSTSYSDRIKHIGTIKRYRWLSLVLLLTAALLALVIGVIVMVYKHSIPDSYNHGTSKSQERKQDSQTGTIYKFDYSTAGGNEQVLINMEMNYTEIFDDDITVHNHFSKRVALHQINLVAGIKICLVKPLGSEVTPRRLRSVLSTSKFVEINSSDEYVIDSKPPSENILSDIRVHQFCGKTDVYMLKKADSSSANSTITMDEMIFRAQDHFSTKKKRSYSGTDQLDQYTSKVQECNLVTKGPKKTIKPRQFECAKAKRYCFRNLIDGRCDNCYDSSGYLVKGCWCPIQVVETCIKITWKPKVRTCCAVDQDPCSKADCETRTIYVPIPKIVFKILSQANDSVAEGDNREKTLKKQPISTA